MFSGERTGRAVRNRRDAHVQCSSVLTRRRQREIKLFECSTLIISGVLFELLSQRRVPMRQNIENDVNPPVVSIMASGMPKVIVEPPQLADVPDAAHTATFHLAPRAAEDQVVAIAA